MTGDQFFTSFEDGDPAPTWTDTIDTDDGKPRSQHATMRTRPGGGPSHPHAARRGVGFTGVRCLHYHGTHKGDGAAYVINRVFEVDLEVSAETELSYLIFPELTGDDLGYPSTYLAVDLVFDDGTELSGLGAVDQLGFELSPRGQGESKALYTGQWNRRVSRIGAVAAGKKITKILLHYAAPHGPARFAGWIDDLRIGARRPRPHRRTPVDYVLTTRGTHSSRDFSRGNTFPATAVPHGFNFWTPLTNAGTLSWLYEYHRGSDEQNRPALQAFGASHQPSPWMGDRQTVQVLPTTQAGRIRPGRRSRALTFKHSNEIARPHYYSVLFDNGVRTEIAPTDHAAMFRFTFPGKDVGLIFDNVNCHGRLTLDPDTGSVSGYSDVRSGLSVGAGRMFFYATFDRKVIDSGRLWRGLSNRVTGFLRFFPADGEDEPTVVTMRIATSLISLAQAKRNLALEIATGEDFESVRDRARAAWDDVLGRIEVEGATDEQLTTLYSNIYRLYLYPNSAFENTGTAQRPEYFYASPFAPRLGADTPTASMAKLVPGKLYVNNGFWDTYRTVWPAYALLTPTRCGELIDGFVQHYRDGGWISRWSSPGYANLMTGTSSDVAFADAYLKGVTNFDVTGAYQAALRNATVCPTSDSVGRRGLDESIFLHYTPSAVDESVSWTLEGCLNDFGIANLARALGDADNHGYLADRARHYVNCFDHDIRFFQGRRSDHRWRLPAAGYDPRVWGHDYTETNGWNTAFSVPHDGQGLANLYGGREALAAKLDEFFATPETGTFTGSYGRTIHEMTEARDVRMGQYGHSNQPSHHIAYMYAHAGQPAKVAEKVREIMSRGYSGSDIGQGYCGDEDNGEMSAWWLFSALGFYPLAVGSPYYVIGSPLFRKAVVHLENGRDLVINAPANDHRNVYVRGLRVDGKPYHRCYLPHDLLAGGAVLDFDMGPEPSDWATGPDALPPSLTEGPEIPLPLHDITDSRSGLPSWSGGGEPIPVFDGTGRESTFDAPDDEPLWIRFSLRDSRATVRRYTLTSGARTGDPSTWALQGSNDGNTWTALDERSDEVFGWRRQTRAFTVARPGEYAHYRLLVTAGSGERTLTIAELELLA
ncbi:GH92 family glycosyl hydrolase [Actinophytocola sp.]|uniref:GH92 family glycosyl hydrolase n=1 Tax=Actinophytocola sp. TaxID=1872138 RepID=UPI002D7E2BA7|nr:GH92 family glycosyl hydrolase [Actinophytocola sp.]HET9140932.1 GH92 family glycosyl hydrolase [Actinophytocola sp.]